jgi:hypothetical protein
LLEGWPRGGSAIDKALQDKAPLRSGRNFGILTTLAVVGFVALVVIEKTASTANLRSGMSEAAAGLMAATLAVIVSHLSHQQGRARRAVMSERGEDALYFRGQGVLPLGASIVMVITAIAVACYLCVSIAAAAALVAAVLSYALADFLHNRSPAVRTRHEWGWMFVAIALAIAGACIWLAPSAAEAVAAIAAAIVTFGGSLVGHGQGASP